MDGFLAVTDVLEPHRLFLPAAVPVSASPAPPSVLVAGDVLLPAEELKKKKKVYYWQERKMHSQMDDLLSAEQNFSDKLLQARSLKAENVPNVAVTNLSLQSL